MKLDGRKVTLARHLGEGRVPQDWEVEGVPTVYVLDHGGGIRHRQVDLGPVNHKLDEFVEKAEAAKWPN